MRTWRAGVQRKPPETNNKILIKTETVKSKPEQLSDENKEIISLMRRPALQDFRIKVSDQHPNEGGGAKLSQKLSQKTSQKVISKDKI